ncbi:MAG TPA: hypothetical protein PLK37_06755 [Terricaulis sp.]|nr:hypothetical protein [Terricaulis sp.]
MAETLITHALALLLALAAIGAALIALSVRALFATCMALAAVSACAAVALMALGAGEGALALALFGAGLAPVLMLAGVLLSARAAKAMKHGPIWFSAVAAGAVGAAIVWAAPELARAPAAPALSGAAAPWLALLLFVAALGVVALLGFGERGPFGGGEP